MDGFSSGCWSGASQATKKATASWSLSNPTTQPLYNGADNARRTKSRRVAGKVKVQVLLGALGHGFEPLSRESTPFSYRVKVELLRVPICDCCDFDHCFCGRLT